MTDQDDSILRRCAFDEAKSKADAQTRWEALMNSVPSPHVVTFQVEAARWQHAQTEPILRALLAECVRLRETVQAFGDGATDTFEQMLKGKWTDEHGHDVHLNAAMLDLKSATVHAIGALAKHEAEMRRLGSAE